MACFIEIMQKFFPDINLSKQISILEGSNIDYISFSFFSTLTLDLKNKNNLEKFKVFKKLIINNLFITKNKSEMIINKFCKAQKCYYGFSKLAYLYKIKTIYVSRSA